MDLDTWIGGGNEVERVVVGVVEVDLGAEDGMGILEFVEGILEKRDLWGFREEEAEDGDAGADWNGLAPAELSASDGSTRGGIGRVALALLLGHCCFCLCVCADERVGEGSV